MKTFKQFALSGMLGLSLTAGIMQAAHADTASAYPTVLAAARIAAQEALAANMTGSTATCYIAEKARQASAAAGIKPNTPDDQSAVARATYQSAQEKKIKNLLKNEVVLDCVPAKLATNGRLPSAAVIGGVALALVGIAAASDDGGTTSNRPVSP